MSKSLRVFVVLALLALPAVAAPTPRQQPSLSERIEAVLRWLRPTPTPGTVTVPRKCGGTVDPNGNCKP